MEWIFAVLGVLAAVFVGGHMAMARMNARNEVLSRAIDEVRSQVEDVSSRVRELADLLDEQRSSLAAQGQSLSLQERALAAAGIEAESARGPAVVIYNPTKDADFDYLRKTMAQAALDAGLDEPIWVETTAEDPGFGQARKALEMGASVIVVAGGDGTVRNVAQEIAGSSTPMGLLPVGTGNLLARNLDLPLNSPRQMAVIALTGRAARIDVGWMEIEQSAGGAESFGPATEGKHAFVVMAGLGFDADIMAAADEQSELKSKIGWLAYVKVALPHLLAKKMRAQITTHKNMRPVEVEARTVMVLNCGELVGGLILDPNAKPDDGWLELAVLDTRKGLIGWADLARKVGLNGVGMKPMHVLGIESSGEIDIHRVNEASIEAESPQLVQVDGDVLGWASRVSAHIDEGALRVRVG